MSLNNNEIDSVCELIRQLCGVSLDPTKAYLVESRLTPILQQENLMGYAELVARARDLTGAPIRQKIVDAITTQETLFFRDSSPFDALRFKALPEMIDSKASSPFPKRLRLWSAASSTGQEPYSIAMVLHDMIPDIHTWDIQILATDICDEAIARASRGWYSNLEVDRGLPMEYRNRYFRQQDGGWQVNDSLRASISFRKLNLLDPFPPIAPIDIIFCRNVAIYFERDKRDDLFRRFKKIMSKEAYLFVGSSESLINIGPEFRPQAHCKSTFYRPNLREPAMV